MEEHPTGFGDLPEDLRGLIDGCLSMADKKVLAQLDREFNQRYGTGVTVYSQDELVEALDDPDWQVIVAAADGLVISGRPASYTCKVIATAGVHVTEFGTVHVQDDVRITADGGRVYAQGRAQVTATGHVSISARGSARIIADGCVVEAQGNAQVTATGRGSVWAKGNARVVADGHTKVSAEGGHTTVSGNASVTACKNAAVDATGNARVDIHNDATVYASGKATVNAFGRAKVHLAEDARASACAGAQVSAHGRATVTAHHNVRVTAHDNTRVTAHDHVRVTAYHQAKVALHDQATVTTTGDWESTRPDDTAHRDPERTPSATRGQKHRTASREHMRTVTQKTARAEDAEARVKRGDVTSQAAFCREVLSTSHELEFLKRLLAPNVFPHITEGLRRDLPYKVVTFEDKSSEQTRAWARYYEDNSISRATHGLITACCANDAEHIRTVVKALIRTGVHPIQLMSRLDGHTDALDDDWELI
ncbi:hypothetical protein AB0N09_33265 [Streptomyces erythrochromogenes]|uniref:hypothetical protein n=1 Tax=Streptomyces erythrochromogenes TaxID=285574 RepID=UPI003416E362